MGTVALIVAAFAVGIILGLELGPSKERGEAERADAFIRGIEYGRKNP